MKRVTKGTNRSFKAVGIMVLIAGIVLCFALSACDKAEEASVETTQVETMDQPAEAADAPAVQDELSAVATTGGVSEAGEAPADAAPADDAPAEPAD
ncbi:MAG TPA: hypothetical protein PLA36_12140 [Deltaproteobacteria bacterium]|nr:hypothetical protein [Deltaproteobacteria bacterium]